MLGVEIALSIVGYGLIGVVMSIVAAAIGVLDDGEIWAGTPILGGIFWPLYFSVLLISFVVRGVGPSIGRLWWKSVRRLNPQAKSLDG